MHNREIVAGIWLAKSSTFASLFLDDWIEYALCNCANEGQRMTNHDNGALIHLIYQKYLHDDSTMCGDLYEQSFSLESYWKFVQCVHDLLHTSKTMRGIRIDQAETSWLKFLEFGWQEKGDWGTPAGPNVVSLWNRWIGNEFIVHTKHIDRLLTRADAECKPQTSHVRPDMLLPMGDAIATMKEESARFGHHHLGDCMFECPPLVAGGPPSSQSDKIAPKCKVLNQQLYQECKKAALGF